ncbi:MAG: DUF4402 domain-containing protein [Pseudomonadota bacterium]|nr:DUF4402 domain-containing protein [Pseudomonadota bacterium]
MQNSLSAPTTRKPLTVRQITPISFGSFTSGSGSITVNANGNHSLTGSVTLLSGSEPEPAEFEILGQPSEEVSVFLPERIAMSTQSGSGSLSVTNLTMIPNATFKLDGTGRARIKVGGTLKINTNTISGPYNGYFDLDVRYAY